MMNYWAKRNYENLNKIAGKTEKSINYKLRVYYGKVMKRVIKDFEDTFNKLIATISEGKQITPADVYKLDRYWQLQNQVKQEMHKLGNYEIALLSKAFEQEWIEVYNSIQLPLNTPTFATVDADSAKAMINTVWLADGKHFSKRIWNNTENLVETLNDGLIHCVITGKKPGELKKILRERFNVSYNKADTLVKTEIAHIQTTAAAQRYKDAGLEMYEFYAEPDDRTCGDCADLHGKKFYYSDMQPGINCPPMHPRDRCTILPVID